MPALRRRWTSAEVRALVDESRAWPRYELIGGELVVTPAPTWDHQTAVAEVFTLLRQYLERQAVGVVLTSPADLELREETITQPDVFVVPVDVEPGGDAMEWRDVRRLLLAVEVISAGSARVDRVEKRELYMSAAVEEYWIVDLDAAMVERWTPSRETPRVERERLEWKPRGAETPLIIDVAGLFGRVSRASRRGRR